MALLVLNSTLTIVASSLRILLPLLVGRATLFFSLTLLIKTTSVLPLLSLHLSPSLLLLSLLLVAAVLIGVSPLFFCLAALLIVSLSLLIL